MNTSAKGLPGKMAEHDYEALLSDVLHANKPRRSVLPHYHKHLSSCHGIGPSSEVNSVHKGVE